MVNARAETEIIANDGAVRNNGAEVAVGAGGLFPLNLVAGGKTLTDAAGNIPTQTLLEYVADEINNDTNTYRDLNTGGVNPGTGNVTVAVDHAFLKLVAIKADNITTWNNNLENSLIQLAGLKNAGVGAGTAYNRVDALVAGLASWNLQFGTGGPVTNVASRALNKLTIHFANNVTQ